MFIYKYRLDLPKAFEKAYEKVRNLMGIILFFPLFGLLIFINKLFWNFKVDFLSVSPVVFLYIIAVFFMGKRLLKPRLSEENIEEYNEELLKDSLKMYYKTMIGIGLYCGLMYVILRLSFIYLFVK